MGAIVAFIYLVDPFIFDKFDFANESVERDGIIFITHASAFFAQLASCFLGAFVTVCNQRKDKTLHSGVLRFLFCLVTCESVKDRGEK